jgi:putative spermidine/putrescine transport system substrate-binding protein
LLFVVFATSCSSFEIQQAIAFDFGEPVNYLESVWSQAQYQFVYLPSRTPTETLPRSFADWLVYAQQRPGRARLEICHNFLSSLFVEMYLFLHSYIFPDPGDFLAARFLKQALIELAPPKYLQGKFNQTRYNEISPLLWNALNSVKPFLWRNGNEYP